MTQLLYRYRDVCDESGAMFLIEDEYAVLKETPCGWWVQRNDGGFLSPELIAHRLAHKRDYGVRFVLSGQGKRYAYPCKAAALRSYLKRKRSQLHHAKIALEKASLGIKVAERLLNVGDDLKKSRWFQHGRRMGSPFVNPQFEFLS